MVADHGGVAVGTLLYRRRVAAGEPLRLDPRPVPVVGREKLLGSIAKRSTVVLCGPGGVGKTTAALEYAYRHLDEYALVWMFRAAEATALLAQFHELAERLDPTGIGERADPVARVHAALARQRGCWLLIFDSARDHAAVRRWLPPQGSGDVLVTTRDGRWPPGRTLPVDGLSTDVAAQFLLNQTGEFDTGSAEAIARRLGGLPLALAQAAAFVAGTGGTLAGYLQLLRRERPGLLPAAATWRPAFDDLRAAGPGPIALLRLLACLAPEDIPVRVLLSAPLPAAVPEEIRAELRPLVERPSGLDAAALELRRYHLIGPPGDLVSVHRLVQAVTLDALEPGRRAAWRAAAAALVEAAVPADVTVGESWPVCALLLRHALLVVDPLSRSMGRLARSPGHAGDYATARGLWQILAESRSARLGPGHPDTLAARDGLAYWSSVAAGPHGDRDGAEDQQQGG